MKNYVNIRVGAIFFIGIVCVFIAACSIRLAPAYDADLASNISTANRNIEILFASISDGVDKSTFVKRRDSYDNIIGSLNALVIQANSRPIPDAAISQKINSLMLKKGVAPLTTGASPTMVPSAVALQLASDTIKKMKDTDSKNGLHSEAIAAFRNQTQTFMAQAITYEDFLKRS